MLDNRFDQDVFPDSTWGICRAHNPSGIVRLVGDDGLPTVNGVCEGCYAEMHDENFISCPVHGIQPVAKGIRTCPLGCTVGACFGPTQEEIEAEARSLGSLFVSRVLAVEDVVASAAAGPANERAGEPGEGIEDSSRPVLGRDPERAAEDGRGAIDGEPAARVDDTQTRWVDPATGIIYIIGVDPAVDSDATWTDPFFVDEA